MGKIIALDLGDVWTGTAISDELGLLARPYQTVKTVSLEEFLEDILKKELIELIVIGNPRTMRGTMSEQTKKVHVLKDTLEKKFDMVSLILWDERLSSKRAASGTKKIMTKEEKVVSHSIAAAFILDSYLEYRRIHDSK